MEEKLSSSERRLRLITENTSDLIVMTDLTGKIEFVNPAHRKMLYADEDLIGTNYFDLIHPDDQEEFLSFIDGVMMDQQDKVGTMTEYRIRDKTGNYKLVETALNVSKTHKGKRGIMVLISRFVF